ncbi:Copper chaperone CopZ [Desulfomicrobium apsheronum]|uniref:Copper chaperone CopZ n=1 Tax=Desulfomicrobium apsheronum TaxID=52560 RepID=A0A1I3UPI2_9BACT|nr:heavy metal-associated domain-containing protein [Desulfomicrobium apsheronum]SFJ83916.1 Copper chaperone CopZ [Desulfomicrobium apsheronum]
MPVIKISGMSCAHCTGSVTKILQTTPGISNISVTLDPGQASFDADPEVNLDQVKDASARSALTHRTRACFQPCAS